MKKFRLMFVFVCIWLAEHTSQALIKQPVRRRIISFRRAQDINNNQNLNQEYVQSNGTFVDSATNLPQQTDLSNQQESLNANAEYTQPAIAETLPNNDFDMQNELSNDQQINNAQDAYQNNNNGLAYQSNDLQLGAHNNLLDSYQRNIGVNGQTYTQPANTHVQPMQNTQTPQVIVYDTTNYLQQQATLQATQITVQHTAEQSTSVALHTDLPLDEAEEEVTVIKVKDFDILETIVSKLRDAFDAYYAMLPNANQDSGPKKNKTIQALNLVTQVTELVTTIVKNKESILSDLKHVEDRLGQMKGTSTDMLKFFELDTQYSQTLKLAKTWMKNDPKFETHMKAINDAADTYNNNVKTLLSSVYDLSKLAEFFYDEIMKLKLSSKANNISDVLVKFDQVIMLLARLMNMKTYIKKSIDNIKTSMNNIKELKNSIQKSLKSTENLSMYYQLQEKEKQSKLLAQAAAVATKSSVYKIAASICIIAVVFK